MAVGALFLGLNVAPTEEMMLISYQMTEWHAFCLVVVSIGLMHGFVFALGFAGGSEVPPDAPWWSPFLRLTLPGYVIALSVSLYLLWVFARLDGVHIDSIVMATVVPPDLVATINRVETVEGGTLVVVIISNKGDQAAAEVAVEATVKGDGPEQAPKEIRFDYVASHAVRRGAFVMETTALTAEDVRLRVHGYVKP